MFTFIKQKLLYKKWLNICLFVGIILLVAVAACLPMYQNMSENQAFQNEMKQYIQDNGTYPCVVSVFQGNTYKKTKEFAEKFRQKNGTYYCRDLKGVSGKGKVVPCPQCIADAVELTEMYLESVK